MNIKKILRKTFWYEIFAKKAGVILGENCFIASRFWSTEAYLITIGNNCQITEGCHIFTHGGAGAVRAIIPKFDCFGKVYIGNNVYLGTNTLIMPGVTIGNNVICAAGSVVTKSIPSNVVVGGNPATIICSINNYIERNKSYNLNSKGLSPQKKKRLLSTLPEQNFIKKKFLKY
jgi:acetyltransferase-like isoleucine patch superfamily enzyme